MSNNTTIPVLELSNCTIAGNPDLLGLGIRLTIYLQTITSALSAAFLDQQHDYLQSSGIIFFISTLAILIREVSNASIRAPEADCVFCLLWLLALSLQSASRARSRTHGRKIIREALLAAAALYASWFWFVGVERLERPRKGDGEQLCEEWAFWIYRKQDMRGEEYIKWQKAIFVILSVVWCCGCCWSVSKHVRGAFDSKKKLISNLSDGPEPLANYIKDMKEQADSHGNPWIKFFVFMFSAGLVLWAAGIFLSVIVPGVELQIQWNDIQGVQSINSVGQLVPFILSVGMLLHVLYSILRGKDEFKEEWEKDSAEGVPVCPQQNKRDEQEELLERDSSCTANMD